MPVAAISVVPVGTGSTSLSAYVAEMQKILAETEGIKYQLTPMATIVEGELEDILRVAQKLHELPFTQGVMRVVTDIRIDDRRDQKLTMEGKVRSVQEKLK
ncbi:MAG: hypothetical protein PWQ91_433 [Eubacteriales bacterium]|nr:hypothetical protein [Eubacteriales bacterium]MDN5363372.1 hypothetical protein [Eubacteriales bacterium]